MAPLVEPETRIKVFISYSRTDKAFAADLVLGLAACGFAPYIDREDIAAGEDWSQRLTGLIGEADTIVYVISPDSLSSQNCSWELAESLRLAKRVLPVVWRAVDDAATPADLKRLNYVFFSGEGRTFATGLSDLAEALRTDIGWIREHTRLAGLAQRWEARGRSEALLLRGDELDAAMAWTTAKPMSATPITDAQADFIKAGTDARAEAKRRAQRARAGLLTTVSLVAVAMAGLAVFAGLQAVEARTNLARKVEADQKRDEADRQRATAEAGLAASRKMEEAANLRLNAPIGLRMAPKDDGYFVVDKGWYQVAANFSGSVARIDRTGGGKAASVSSGFLIDGALIHPRFAGETLLLAPVGAPITIEARAHRPASPASTANTPADTLAPDDPIAIKMAAQSGGVLPPTVPETPRIAATPPADTPPADVLPADIPFTPQTTLSPGPVNAPVDNGPEAIAVTFPVINTTQMLAGKEILWKTPAEMGGVFPFELWRLDGALPFGARPLVQDDIDCQGFATTPADRAVGAFTITLPTVQDPSPETVMLGVSVLLDRTDVYKMLYTHATSIVAAGAPVFDLETRKVFAIHIGSEPYPGKPTRRRGFGMSLRVLLDLIRGKLDDAQAQPGPVCGTP